MEQSNSLSIVALIAAIVAIGLGLAALILALDDDDPRFAIGGPITVQSQFGKAGRLPTSRGSPPKAKTSPASMPRPPGRAWASR